MDDIFYSVEYLDKANTFNCWNQHALTSSRIMARLYLFEAKMKHGRKTNNFRIREV